MGIIGKIITGKSIMYSSLDLQLLLKHERLNIVKVLYTIEKFIYNQDDWFSADHVNSACKVEVLIKKMQGTSKIDNPSMITIITSQAEICT